MCLRVFHSADLYRIVRYKGPLAARNQNFVWYMCILIQKTVKSSNIGECLEIVENEQYTTVGNAGGRLQGSRKSRSVFSYRIKGSLNNITYYW